MYINRKPGVEVISGKITDIIADHSMVKIAYSEYDRSTKGYIQERLPEEKTLDYFVCLHRESLNSSARDKQVFFLKDGQDRQFYVLDNHFPIMQNFSRLIQSLQN